MKKIIQEILKEVDSDIRGLMLDDSNTINDPEKPNDYYKNWEVLHSPALVILEWQKLRDRKNKNHE